MISSPACGPCDSAIAIAQLSSMTGETVSRTSAPYRAAIWPQSRGCSVCSDAIAAWITYGPRPCRATARSSRARPLAI
jgi:hypothetical protein